MIKVTDEDIKEIVRQRIKENPYADLNDLDVSEVMDMSNLFFNKVFKGDVSRWDTHSVVSMSAMFEMCAFDGDISGWDTSSVIDMSEMFCCCEFNKDISRWDTSSVMYMRGMFGCCEFNKDISRWDISSVIDMRGMFSGNKNFNQDISGWVIDKDCLYYNMFKNSGFMNMFKDGVCDLLPKGMLIDISFGDDYNDIFKQKMEKIIKTL